MKLVLLLPLLLSGCLLLGPGTEPVQDGFDDATLEAEFQQAKRLDFDLSDFDGDVLGLEVITREGAPIRGNVALDLTTSEGLQAGGQTMAEPTPRPCLAIHTASYRAQVIGSLRVPGLLLSAAGTDAQARVDTLATTMTSQLPFEAKSWDERHSAPIVVALDGAEAWRAAGSEVKVTLQSSESFWYRVRAAGDLACTMLPSEGQEGATVDLGSALVVRGEKFYFDVDEDNIVGVFIAGNGGYDAVLSAAGKVVDEAGAAGGEYRWYWGSGRLPAGSYLWHVKELQGSNEPLTGTTTTAVIVFDLEPWAMVAPWESGPEATSAEPAAWRVARS